MHIVHHDYRYHLETFSYITVQSVLVQKKTTAIIKALHSEWICFMPLAIQLEAATEKFHSAAWLLTPYVICIKHLGLIEYM